MSTFILLIALYYFQPTVSLKTHNWDNSSIFIPKENNQDFSQYLYVARFNICATGEKSNDSVYGNVFLTSKPDYSVS